VPPTIKQFAVDGLIMTDIDGLDPVDKLAVQRLLVEGVDLIPESMRCDMESNECQGTMQSVIFGVWQNGVLVGAVSVGNVNLVQQVGVTLEVNAIVFPYLPGVADERASIRAIYQHLFQQPVELENGQQLAVLDVMEFKKLKEFDPQDAQHMRAKMITEEAEGAGFPEFLPDPADPARDIVRVRRAGP
jgi:hypothetical protein